MTNPEVVEGFRRARKEIARSVVGLEDAVELLCCAILASRHVLMEGVPGLGKTHLVKTLAGVLGCEFRRIQFTPDLLPADILGGYVYDARDGSFSLRRGPIFAQVILADEINRSPAKTQSAMLEVMQERQVTIEGETLPLERPFFVFATQNPLEHEGVYPLPQAQLDRFALRILMDYPATDEEMQILRAHLQDLPDPSPVLDARSIIAAQGRLEGITVAEGILKQVVEVVRRTRAHQGVTAGGSPRLGLDVVHLSRARALLDGRGHVIPDDVKTLFLPAANHRIVLSPQAEIAGLTVEQVVHEAIGSTEMV